jgi:hypothetical protein
MPLLESEPENKKTGEKEKMLLSSAEGGNTASVQSRDVVR